jgi:hypothetical protein
VKIVNLETFRAMPPGTVFSKYSPCAFGDLFVKVDTWDSDFLFQDITTNAVEANDSEEWIDKLIDAEKNGTTLRFDFDCTQRDGCFEPAQLFAVWDKDDVKALIARLERCLE